MHDSGEVDSQGDCHPGTRITVQQVIARWAENRDPEFLIHWLIGSAGAGKSAIMRTVAKILEAKGLLLGTFFCFRTSPRRSDASLIIPTIGDQIIRHIPSLADVVDEVLTSDPNFFARTMEIQAMRLIVDPLNSLNTVKHDSTPYVILFDGLDEIDGTEGDSQDLRLHQRPSTSSHPFPHREPS